MHVISMVATLFVKLYFFKQNCTIASLFVLLWWFLWHFSETHYLFAVFQGFSTEHSLSAQISAGLYVKAFVTLLTPTKYSLSKCGTGLKVSQNPTHTVTPGHTMEISSFLILVWGASSIWRVFIFFLTLWLSLLSSCWDCSWRWYGS